MEIKNKPAALILVLSSFLCCLNDGIAQTTKAEKEFFFAQKLFDDNLLALAAEQFEQYVAQYPNNENSDDAQFLSGEAYYTTGDFKKAFDAFKILELSYPQSSYLPKARFQLAECQYKSGDFKAAGELFKRVPFFHPESEYAPKAYLMSGKSFDNIGATKDALDSFLQLIKNYPDTPERIESHLQIVNLYLKQENMQEALNQIENIFKVYGNEVKDARVYWLRAFIFEQLGQLDEAESIYANITNQFKSDSLATEALLKLGYIAGAKGNYDKVISLFDACIAKTKNKRLLRQSYIGKGEVLLAQNNIAAAHDAYRNAIKLNVTSPDPGTNLKFAKVLLELKKYATADSILTGILQNRGEGGFREITIAESFSLLIDVLAMQEKYKEALDLVNLYAAQILDKNYLAQIAFKKAQILKTGIKNIPGAIRAYENFIESFPTNTKVDDAQYELANCYFSLAEYKLAVSEYQNYLSRYPCGDLFDEINQKIYLINNTINLDGDFKINEITNVLAQYIENKTLDINFEIGKIYYNAKNFENALNHFKAILVKNHQQAYPDLYFYLAQTYLRLGGKQRLFGNNNDAINYSDSVKVNLLNISSDYSRIAEVDYILADIDFSRASSANADSLRQKYATWELKYPDGLNLCFVNKRLGDLYFKSSERPDSASVNLAYNYYNKITEQKNCELIEQALYEQILCLSYLHKDSLVQKNTDYFIQSFPGSQFVAEVLMQRAHSAQNLNDFETAKNIYTQIKKKYFYSKVADKATLHLANLYFKNKNYKSAIDTYNLLNRTSVDDKSYGFIYLNKALAYERIDSLDNAIKNYVKFLYNTNDQSTKIDAMLAIGRISVKKGNLVFAEAYYKSILGSTAGNLYKYNANLAIADIKYSKNLFEEARDYYITARQFSDADSTKIIAESGAIRSLYKLKQFAPAETEVQKFKKNFTNAKEYDAQFLLDKGNALISDKNFPEAEKVFKELKSNYKNSDWGALGEFGLGAVYLITNHTEDALKILTDIPNNYPDSEVTPMAYYNLGDFYYKSQQIENAILAFRKVAEHPKANEYQEKSLLYLIQCYRDARFWDQAIQLTREYLQKYPKSELSFRKKIDLAQFLMNLKEYSRAIGNFEELLPYADAESEAEIQFYIAESYKEMGNFKRAISEYLKVKYLTKPTKLPWQVTALFESGRCLLRLNETEQAKKIFQRIVKEQGVESNFGRFAQKNIEDIDNNQTAANGNSLQY